MSQGNLSTLLNDSLAVDISSSSRCSWIVSRIAVRNCLSCAGIVSYASCTAARKVSDAQCRLAASLNFLNASPLRPITRSFPASAYTLTWTSKAQSSSAERVDLRYRDRLGLFNVHHILAFGERDMDPESSDVVFIVTDDAVAIEPFEDLFRCLDSFRRGESAWKLGSGRKKKVPRRGGPSCCSFRLVDWRKGMK